MTLAEQRIVYFLSKTTLKGSQLNALVELEGKVTMQDAKEAVVSLLHEGVLLLSADRILSLAPIEEDM